MLDAAVRVFTGNKPGTRTNSELTPEASKCALQINGASRLKVIVLRFGLALRGLRLAEPCNLMDNFCWANDYPHHEGTWPHSAEAIERTMPMLNDTQRAKILGLNAARLFKLDVPKHQQLAVS